MERPGGNIVLSSPQARDNCSSVSPTARVKSAPERSAPLNVAPVSTAPAMLAPLKLAPSSFARLRWIPVSSAPRSRAPVRFVPWKATRRRNCPSKFASRRSHRSQLMMVLNWSETILRQAPELPARVRRARARPSASPRSATWPRIVSSCCFSIFSIRLHESAVYTKGVAMAYRVSASPTASCRRRRGGAPPVPRPAAQGGCSNLRRAG